MHGHEPNLKDVLCKFVKKSFGVQARERGDLVWLRLKGAKVDTEKKGGSKGIWNLQWRALMLW